MAIKPFDVEHNRNAAMDIEAISLPDELQDALADAGLAPKLVDGKDKDSVRKIFNRAGASVDDAASTIQNVMQSGDSAASRLNAARLVLEVHGILQDMEHSNIPNITINIQGSDNKTLVNLVLPT